MKCHKDIKRQQIISCNWGTEFRHLYVRGTNFLNFFSLFSVAKFNVDIGSTIVRLKRSNNVR